MITQEIDLNLIPSSEPVIVHLNQYDEGAGRLICHLYNGSVPYTPTAATVKVQGTKPDNHAFQYYCDISGSTVTVDINLQMTACAGRVPTQLVVTEYTGVTGSFAFELDIQESTLKPDIDISDTDLPIYTEEAQEAARRAVQSAISAEESAREAAEWSANPPYIGTNDHWYVYDTTLAEFVDSGVVAKGEDGSTWYRGIAVEGKSVTPTSFDTGLTVKAGDFYLNVSEGAIYHCVTGGIDTVATWSYDFTMTGGGGGGTDNYNDLINQPSIGGVTLIGNKTIGDLGGVQSFKGRSGAVVPAQGDYTDAQVILTSTMHIGGETQTNVQQALVALEGKKSGLLPYLYIDSEAGSTVTVVAPDSTVIIPTQASTGHWECEVPDYGIYVIHSVLAGQGDATLSLTVDDVKEYHVTDSHYDFTINVTADVGASIRVEAGAETYTGTGTGSPVAFVAHQASTQYTITETLDGYTDVKTVTSASVTGGSVNVTLHVFAATLNISTNSPELRGQAIVIRKSGAIIGETSFTDAGQASYVVHETGTFTLTCTYQGQPYSEDVLVSAETTYPVVIDTIPDGSTVLPTDDIQTWLKCAGLDKAYTMLSEVLADHDTLYILMGNDNAVDYLVRSTTWASGITADEYAMKYIGKWNYASDTLLADDTTWLPAICASTYMESVLNAKVPTMTNDTTPSGVASASTNNSDAWKAFDGTNTDGNDCWSSANNSGANSWLRYSFPNATKVHKVVGVTRNNPDGTAIKSPATYKIQASNDGFMTTVDLTDVITNSVNTKNATFCNLDIDNDTAYTDYRIYILTVNGGATEAIIGQLQFYGRTDVTENVIDIYSAASDTVTITPQSGSPITCVTDSTGHGTVARNDMPTGTYTLSSIIAKDPSNLSNDYTKTVTITEGTSEVYFMPDGEVLYWWGYRHNIEDTSTANGWTASASGNTYVPVEYNPNNVLVKSTSGGQYSGIGTSQILPSAYQNGTAVAIGKKTGGTDFGLRGFNITSKTVNLSGSTDFVISATSITKVSAQCGTYVQFGGQNSRYGEIYALYVEEA